MRITQCRLGGTIKGTKCLTLDARLLVKKRKLREWLILAPLALVTALQAIRAEVPEKQQHWFFVLSYLPDWQWRTWAIIALVALCLAILEGAFRVRRQHPVRESKQEHEWWRLTDADRATLSLRLRDGNCYKVAIYTSPARDCVLLGEDFYRFFEQMRWSVARPEIAHAIKAPPGIQILTVPYTEPGGVIKNIKERSGAALLVKGLAHIGLPVIYGIRGGSADDLTVYMTIGVKPDSGQ
jgi:hypothetical protein